MKKLSIRKSLYRQITELSYSHTDELSEENFKESLAAIDELQKQYGYAMVLGMLYRQWSIEKALIFFEKMMINSPKSKKVQTIGTIYHRGYNGGCERVQAQLMTLWVNMGYNVVFFSEEPANPLDFPYPSSVKIILIPKTSDVPGRLMALQKGIKNEGVDVLVNHDWSHTAVLWELMLAKTLNISYINYIHAHFSWAFQLGSYSLYFMRICRLCDAVVAISETNARFFSMCGCKSYLVENPIPEDLKHTEEISLLKSRHVLMVGRVAHEKYPMEAIQVFDLVHKACPDATLDVVGADSDGNVVRMAQYCRKNGLSSSVIFHGLKSSEKVNEFFLNSSCLLFTSKLEGYPMVILEAKAHGVPIAMYDLPFLTMVKDKKGILTAPVGDIQGLANNIIQLLQNEELRQSCGQDAREDFEKYAVYDLRQAWSDIFSLCEHHKPLKSSAYFNPSELSAEDNLIVPPLLEAIKKSYDIALCQSTDYRIGKKLLAIPRKIKRMLKGLIYDV